MFGVENVYTEMEYAEAHAIIVKKSWWPKILHIIILEAFLLMLFGGIACAIVFSTNLVLKSGVNNPLADVAVTSTSTTTITSFSTTTSSSSSTSTPLSSTTSTTTSTTTISCQIYQQQNSVNVSAYYYQIIWKNAGCTTQVLKATVALDAQTVAGTSLFWYTFQTYSYLVDDSTRFWYGQTLTSALRRLDCLGY